MRDEAPSNCLARSATEEQIALTERELGVTLPWSFRRFLREFGHASYPEEIYGVLPTLLPGMRLVTVTLRERHEAEPEMPDPLVPFSPDGWGNHYCLDTSRMLDAECPVVFWNHELPADQTPRIVSATFLDWLESEVREEIKTRLQDEIQEAEQFLLSHRWCLAVRRRHYVCGWPGILTLYRFEIEAAPGADSVVWVVIGDVPPAYLDLLTCPDAHAALEGYCGALQEWVDRVQDGKSVEDAIPVLRRGSWQPVPPTAKYAEMLQGRIEFIRDRLLTDLEDRGPATAC